MVVKFLKSDHAFPIAVIVTFAAFLAIVVDVHFFGGIGEELLLIVVIVGMALMGITIAFAEGRDKNKV